jgi:peptidoglycan/xylan/chitin deacetylase (PgdA/CDA1 family)
VTAAAFEWQMAFLARHGYRVVTLDELVQALQSGKPAPKRTVVVTFDDGYEETHTVAWPVLRRHKFPATVFVAPAEVGLKGFATWDQVRELATDGFTIGSHTTHHSFIPTTSADTLHAEVAGSKQEIEEQINRPVAYLSYPIGGYTEESQRIAKEAGYRAACTTNRGLSRQVIDLFALRRVKMTDRDCHPLIIRAKLSGYYDAFRTLKPPS